MQLINLIDPWGLQSIPDGFFEHNEDKFSPTDFFNESTEAQQYEIDRFNKRFLFDWNNRGYSDLAHGLDGRYGRQCWFRSEL